VGFDLDGDAPGDLCGKRVLSHPTVWRWVQQVIFDIVATVGYVGIYDWNGQGWAQVGSNVVGETLGELFGWSLTLSATGNRLAVGAPCGGSNGPASGLVCLFDWNGSEGAQVGPTLVGETAKRTIYFVGVLASCPMAIMWPWVRRAMTATRRRLVMRMSASMTGRRLEICLVVAWPCRPMAIVWPHWCQ
jgi:hypothetical protein